VRPFDVCSTYYAMAFILQPKNGNPPVMLIGDHYIEWDQSRLTDFESYLEMLLATRGIVTARDRIYNEYRGDLKPLLVTKKDYWTNRRIPKMFRKKA
jgi:hypothetical protein